MQDTKENVTADAVQMNDTIPEQLDIRNMDDERLIDIYIFTGLTVATIVITLARSFLFFNVSSFDRGNNVYRASFIRDHWQII